MEHSIGTTIAHLRKEKGWTQIELAEKLNVSDKTISKWEKDTGAPSVEFYPLLADLFETTIDYLMTGKKIMQYQKPNSSICYYCGANEFKRIQILEASILATEGEVHQTVHSYSCKNCGRITLVDPKRDYIWQKKLEVKRRAEGILQQENLLAEEKRQQNIQRLRKIIEDENSTIKQVKEAQQELKNLGVSPNANQLDVGAKVPSLD